MMNLMALSFFLLTLQASGLLTTSPWRNSIENGVQKIKFKDCNNIETAKNVIRYDGPILSSYAKYYRNESQLNVLKRTVSISAIDLSVETEINISRCIALLYLNVKSMSKGLGQYLAMTFKKLWWCFPMILILFPTVALINGSYAQMPSWWSMCNLNYLHSTRVGHCICFGFLASNVFYFLSGLYLLKGIPKSSLLRVSKSKIVNLDDRNEVFAIPNHKIRYPLLGWLVLCSGGMSLLYHSFQACGAINIAESLCFIDHGLALSSGCCFFDKCGIPSLKTLLIGSISLCMLSIGGDVYPIIHSFWHLGSAGATISWALDGSTRRKKFIIKKLRERRKDPKLANH